MKSKIRNRNRKRKYSKTIQRGGNNFSMVLRKNKDKHGNRDIKLYTLTDTGIRWKGGLKTGFLGLGSGAFIPYVDILDVQLDNNELIITTNKNKTYIFDIGSPCQKQKNKSSYLWCGQEDNISRSSRPDYLDTKDKRQRAISKFHSELDKRINLIQDYDRPGKPPRGHWRCPICTTDVNNSLTQCPVCGTLRGPPVQWSVERTPPSPPGEEQMYTSIGRQQRSRPRHSPIIRDPTLLPPRPPDGRREWQSVGQRYWRQHLRAVARARERRLDATDATEDSQGGRRFRNKSRKRRRSRVKRTRKSRKTRRRITKKYI